MMNVNRRRTVRSIAPARPEHDAVDRITGQWKAVRPDVDIVAHRGRRPRVAPVPSRRPAAGRELRPLRHRELDVRRPGHPPPSGRALRAHGRRPGRPVDGHHRRHHQPHRPAGGPRPRRAGRHRRPPQGDRPPHRPRAATWSTRWSAPTSPPSERSSRRSHPASSRSWPTCCGSPSSTSATGPTLPTTAAVEPGRLPR